ncbi:MAG: hypothetical protein QOH72_1187 [Solirubrobacteraceae bacterium]|nr:hypothetical protein [Solirubrobacteraceae bacterium]
MLVAAAYARKGRLLERMGAREGALRTYRLRRDRLSSPEGPPVDAHVEYGLRRARARARALAATPTARIRRRFGLE